MSRVTLTVHVVVYFFIALRVGEIWLFGVSGVATVTTLELTEWARRLQIAPVAFLPPVESGVCWCTAAHR